MGVHRPANLPASGIRCSGRGQQPNAGNQWRVPERQLEELGHDEHRPERRGVHQERYEVRAHAPADLNQARWMTVLRSAMLPERPPDRQPPTTRGESSRSPCPSRPASLAPGPHDQRPHSPSALDTGVPPGDANVLVERPVGEQTKGECVWDAARVHEHGGRGIEYRNLRPARRTWNRDRTY